MDWSTSIPADDASGSIVDWLEAMIQAIRRHDLDHARVELREPSWIGLGQMPLETIVHLQTRTDAALEALREPDINLELAVDVLKLALREMSRSAANEP